MEGGRSRDVKCLRQSFTTPTHGPAPCTGRGCVPEGLLLFRELGEEGVGKQKVVQVHLACD